MPALDYECLVLRKLFQILHDQTVLHPVLAYLSRFAVCNQLVWVEGDIETEVVIDHHLKSFAFDALSSVCVDGLGFQVALGAVAVTVDFSTRFQLV